MSDMWQRLSIIYNPILIHLRSKEQPQYLVGQTSWNTGCIGELWLDRAVQCAVTKFLDCGFQETSFENNFPFVLPLLARAQRYLHFDADLGHEKVGNVRALKERVLSP